MQFIIVNWNAIELKPKMKKMQKELGQINKRVRVRGKNLNITVFRNRQQKLQYKLNETS